MIGANKIAQALMRQVCGNELDHGTRAVSWLAHHQASAALDGQEQPIAVVAAALPLLQPDEVNPRTECGASCCISSQMACSGQASGIPGFVSRVMMNCSRRSICASDAASSSRRLPFSASTEYTLGTYMQSTQRMAKICAKLGAERQEVANSHASPRPARWGLPGLLHARNPHLQRAHVLGSGLGSPDLAQLSAWQEHIHDDGAHRALRLAARPLPCAALRQTMMHCAAHGTQLRGFLPQLVVHTFRVD